MEVSHSYLCFMRCIYYCSMRCMWKPDWKGERTQISSHPSLSHLFCVDVDIWRDRLSPVGSGYWSDFSQSCIGSMLVVAIASFPANQFWICGTLFLNEAIHSKKSLVCLWEKNNAAMRCLQLQPFTWACTYNMWIFTVRWKKQYNPHKLTFLCTNQYTLPCVWHSYLPIQPKRSRSIT